MFVWQGERVDGRDFAKQAVENGAKALLVSRKLDVNVSQILVPDTLEALFEFAAKYRDMFWVWKSFLLQAAMVGIHKRHVAQCVGSKLKHSGNL